MTDAEEMQLIKETERAAKARAVLDAELFKEAVALIEQDTLEKWKTCPVRDVEGQTALRLKWQIIQEVKRHLADVMMTGKMAAIALAEKRSLVSRARAAAHEFRR